MEERSYSFKMSLHLGSFRLVMTAFDYALSELNAITQPGPWLRVYDAMKDVALKFDEEVKDLK